MSSLTFSQDLRQRQSLVLAPQLRQSLKILQVAALDLRAVIQEELQTNPTLEELPGEGVSLDEERDRLTADEESAANDPGDQDDVGSDALDFSKTLEILEKFNRDQQDYASPAAGAQSHTAEDAERRQHLFDSLVAETSLQEHLLHQTSLLELTPPVRAALEYLVGGLDERGFVTQSVSDLALQADLPLEAMQAAATLLKTFEPVGIGANGITECLLLQLQAKGRSNSLAARIIRDHFELLTRRRIPEIARQTGMHIDEVQDSIEEIGSLDPAPGRRYAEDQNRIVVPDVTIEQDGDEWKIVLNNDYIPRLRISNTYREMIARGTITKQERDYLRERIRSGRFIINSIEQRQQTIERITREILNVQHEFFEEGVSKLRPLTMTQVADAVGVHETTVSRAIANKFIQTPHGVFDFKYFFTPGYAASDGESVSNTSVKEMINDQIAAEDRSRPLSDQDIVIKLKDKGINIARRTVAKYREELGLLPSNLRREYN